MIMGRAENEYKDLSESFFMLDRQSHGMTAIAGIFLAGGRVRGVRTERPWKVMEYTGEAAPGVHVYAEQPLSAYGRTPKEQFEAILEQHELWRKIDYSQERRLSTYLSRHLMRAAFSSSGCMRSGLSQTSSFNFQLRVDRDQRRGLRCLASA
jgi:hypothetical protein